MNSPSIHGVYGKDNEIDVYGGDVKCEVKDGTLHITGFNPLTMKQR